MTPHGRVGRAAADVDLRSRALLDGAQRLASLAVDGPDLRVLDGRLEAAVDIEGGADALGGLGDRLGRPGELERRGPPGDVELAPRRLLEPAYRLEARAVDDVDRVAPRRPRCGTC